MKDFHGMIFAYSASPELSVLVKDRTAASLPFCGRYRLIDFALSSMRNAGILDVGVIMQRDYQSLLDYMGSGKTWDMSRHSGGLRMLPPFGLPEYHTGNYTGTIEALNAVSTYINGISEKYIVLMLGNLCANIDLSAPMEQHRRSGAEITAICGEGPCGDSRYRFVQGEDGFVSQISFGGEDGGATSLEAYVINKSTLLGMMEQCKQHNLYRFHKDALSAFMERGGRMDVYLHRGYSSAIRSIPAYYKASMDMLKKENRDKLFSAELPVRTRDVEEVSTYYGVRASSRNCLVADNCIIEGDMENCIVFSGVRVAPGVTLRDSIIFSGCELGKWTELDCVIADKYCTFAPGTTLIGSSGLPFVVPKHSSI